ncbi:MAG: hypothetical protein ABFR63_07880, partial [Thermodesulfobacteriota bacterium]
MSDTILGKQQSRTGAIEQDKSTVSTEIDKVIIGTVAAFAAIIGLWSFACLASALIQAKGPIGLAAS